MSKTVKQDHELNKGRLADLITLAQGGRTQKQFSEDCGLSKSYICRFLGGKFDKPPIPSTLKKIAATAANNVTYKDLLDAAGYDSDKYTASSAVIQEHAAFEKLALATVTSSLSQSNISWTATPSGKRSLADFKINITESSIIKEWWFTFKHEDSLSSDVNSVRQIFYYYGMLACRQIETGMKISIVTDSASLFDTYVQIAPYSLPILISIILVDTRKMSVIKEQYVPSALEVDNEIKEKFHLSTEKIDQRYKEKKPRQ